MTIIRKYNSMLPDYLDRFFGADYEGLNNSNRLWRPSVNVLENNDNFLLEVAAPGYDKKDFSVNVEKGQLTIRARNERKQENKYALKEFNTDGFERVFSLSKNIEFDNIHANYKDGILYVTLPKKEEAKVKPPRMIEIN